MEKDKSQAKCNGENSKKHSIDPSYVERRQHFYGPNAIMKYTVGLHGDRPYPPRKHVTRLVS